MVRPKLGESPVFLRRFGPIACGLGIASAIGSEAAAARSPSDLLMLNRLTWGVNAGTLAAARQAGLSRWVEDQLKGSDDPRLPDAAEARVAAMRISREPMVALVAEEEAANRAANALTDPEAKKAAQQAYQQSMNGLAREAQERALLRDLYAPDQLREQLVWFWFNQFNVQAQKRDIRAMVGDYEERAIRPHALGKFRDLLEATLRHPAMLRYLDNDQNATKHVNENYAREIMELHTMGVGSGYTQKDVQELARILTGVGVSTKPEAPKLKPEWQKLYIRDGLFEFNPARHDFGDKEFLGHKIKGTGFDEVEQALDLIAASPATARHVSQRLAAFFVGDAPPEPLVDRMARSFRASHGDIAAVLKTMIGSKEFRASLGGAFKDPVHYTVSALRVAYDAVVVRNPDPALGWLSRMGEGLYAHETPDGYPLASAAWTGPGQMALRFEIARQIGAGPAALFRPGATAPLGPPVGTPPVAPSPPAPSPDLRNGFFEAALAPGLGPATQAALGQARSPQEWNALLLSSPDFMFR